MNHGRMLMILLIAGQLGASGCSCSTPKKPSGEEKIVAKINKYNMTVEDFRDSARAVSGTKEQMLDALITKNILIQEAQKQNFDKDKAFMKEIERYWEQALLKLLIRKKTAELTTVYGGDKKRVEAALEEWVKELRARANVKIYKENFDGISAPKEVRDGKSKE